MPSTIKLLITDLDNTLYDWVTYFSASFYRMIEVLSEQLGIEEEILLSEFREVHKRYGNTEQPFALTEVQSIVDRFPGKSPAEIIAELDPALHAFNRKRKETLVLYPGVKETLEELNRRGITLIAHTESTVHNALFRLNRLEVKQYFKKLYTPEGIFKPHPIPEKNLPYGDDGFVAIVPQIDRKPNPRLLTDISKMEGITPGEMAYIGDSLTRDISMAKEAGVMAIWAKYGKSFSGDSWNKLVKVTHWTDDDVNRETWLREKYSSLTPDYTIDSFADILNIIL